ncbi:MAG: protoheme IX farnesyltransferase [Acidimicrobiales bacterium]|nr:protoheme IX farnesyltransferase [Acidimicrobiales bacterium]RZV44933.1 MAG: protoheme IX farnesyltransferase [Acidimicrobiales bacterium]
MTTTASAPPTRSKVAAYVALTKPRIIELLLITTVPTMIVAERGLPSIWLMVATVIGGTFAAGGANAVNMYVDRDIDKIMKRTEGRPLVTGEIEPRNALAFSIGLLAVAGAWLAGFVNPLSAFLALAAAAFYIFIYTLWLKRTSRQNIVIGGAAGCMPVLVGWAAVTNSISWEPVVLFAVIFLWTPPHFWALAVKYRDDYSAANVPMMPSVASLQSTARQIVAYTVAVWAVSLAFIPIADMGWIYAVAAVVLGGAFTAYSVALLRDPTPGRAMTLFTFSITYLSGLFVAMAADQLIL